MKLCSELSKTHYSTDKKETQSVIKSVVEGTSTTSNLLDK